MKLAERLFYTVIAFSEKQMTVCKFRSKNKRFVLTGHTEASMQNNGASALPQLLKQVGGAEGFVLLTGVMPDGEFFRCPGLTDLSVKQLRNAFSFELPGRMMKVPENPCMQFFPLKAEGPEGEWNVFVFPEQSMNRMAELLAAGHLKADEYLYPLLGVKPSDPPLYLPLTDPDFLRAGGEWVPTAESDKKLDPAWKSELEKYFEIPEETDLLKYLECFLAVRLTMLPEFAHAEPGVRVLPNALRPKRLRLHAAVAVILLLIVGGIHLSRMTSDRYRLYREFRELETQRDSLQKKILTLRTHFKKTDKEQKEIAKVMSSPDGAASILEILNEITEVLPSDVLVSSFRYNDPGLDLMLQTESTNLNLTQVLKGLDRWQVEQLNQRTMNGSISMITLKLAPKDGRTEK